MSFDLPLTDLIHIIKNQVGTKRSERILTVHQENYSRVKVN